MVGKEKSIQDVFPKAPQAMRSLRQEYAITLEEEEQILANLEWEAELLRRADILLNQLQELSERYQERYQVLRQPLLPDKAAAWTLLQTVQQKQRLITKAQDLLGVYPEDGKSLRIQTEKRVTEEGCID